MQFPIQVISSQEASRLANMDKPAAVDDGAWVEPQHWRDNADEAEFVSWKQTFRQKGKRSGRARKAKEGELQRTSDLQASFSRFIASYPLEVVQEMERQVGLNREQVRELESQEDSFRKSIRQAEQTIGQHNSIMDEQKGEMVQLRQWIEKGRNICRVGERNRHFEWGIDQLIEQQKFSKASGTAGSVPWSKRSN